MFDAGPPQDFETRKTFSADAVVMLDQAICLVEHASLECMGNESETPTGPGHFFLVFCLLGAALRTLRDAHPEMRPQDRSTRKGDEMISLDRAISLLEQASCQALDHPITSAVNGQRFWKIHCIVEGALMEVRDARSELEPDSLMPQATSNPQEMSHV